MDGGFAPAVFQCIRGGEWGGRAGNGPRACMEPISPDVPSRAVPREMRGTGMVGSSRLRPLLAAAPKCYSATHKLERCKRALK